MNRNNIDDTIQALESAITEALQGSSLADDLRQKAHRIAFQIKQSRGRVDNSLQLFNELGENLSKEQTNRILLIMAKYLKRANF